MSPADEPTPWELQRSLERLDKRLGESDARGERHVSTESLAAILGRYDEQLKGLNEDVAQERGLREADIHALRDWVKTEIERLDKRLKDADEKAKEQDRERRADRRIIYAAAAALVANVLFEILNRTQGTAP